MLRVPCPVLLGREHDVSGVVDALHEAQSGRGSLLVVTGEAGIGKSRLVKEVAAQAGALDGVVLQGRARERSAEGFQALREALVSFSRLNELPRAEELGPYRAVLGTLLPAWSGPTQIDTSSILLLAEALLRLLRVIADEAFAVLVLEDLHWADTETLLVAEYLAEHAAHEPVLVLVTARPGVSATTDDWMYGLSSSRLASVRALAPLPPHEVSELAAACLDLEELPGGTGALLARRSGGIPLFVEELVRTIAHEGGFDAAGWLSDGFDVATATPATLAKDVERRVNALSDPCRRLLRAVAVVGDVVPHSLAIELAGLDEHEGAVARRDGVAAGLLVDEAAAVGPRHALIGEAIRAGVPVPERRALARRVIDALHRRGVGGPAADVELPRDVLARLSEESGDLSVAADILLELGRDEFARGALATAEVVLRRAVSLAPGAATGSASRSLLVDVLCQAGRIDDALALVDTASDDLGDHRADAIRVTLAGALVAGGRLEAGETLLAAVHPDEHAQGPIRSQANLVRASLAMARDEVDVAVDIARRTLDDDATTTKARCEALMLLGRAARAEDLERARMAFEAARATSVDGGLLSLSIEAMHELATVAMLDSGSIDLLLEARQSAFDAAALRTAAEIDVQLAGICALRLEPDRALLHALRATDVAERLRLPVLHALALARQGSAHAVGRRRPAMESVLDEALRRQPDHADTRALAWEYRGICSLLEGDQDRAAAELETASHMAGDSLGTAAAPLRSLHELLSQVRGASPLAEHPTPVPLLRALYDYAAAVHVGASDPSQATRRAAEADRLLDARPGFLGLQHLARHLIARRAIEHRWGEPERWLRAAIGYFDDRHPPVASSCRRLLREAGFSVPRRGRGAGPVPPALLAAGVTSRECDVLALVGQGRRNQQIAEQLFLSTRTVEKHVERLRRKIGAASRDDLVEAARRLGVVDLRAANS